MQERAGLFMEATMRQAVMTAPGKISFGQVDVPQPGPGQVLLHIQRIGVCGSDVHVYHGKHPFTPYPVVQGHEFSAVVVAVGSGVTNVKVGTKATATPQEVCGVCRPCKSGRYNVCEKLKVRGFQAPGVGQDYFVTEADKLVPLPDHITFDEGAFVEPVSVAVHSTGRAGDLTGHNVVIAGAGPIGNLAAQACKIRGANKVLITDVSDYRLEIAKAVGIDAVSNVRNETLADAVERAFGGEGFDVAMDAAGVEVSVSSLVKHIDKGGRIVILAVFSEPPRVDMSVLCEHELTICGTMMYRHEDYEQAVQWIADGSIQLPPLLSKHFPFEQFPEAYRFIDAEGEKTMKVMIDLA
jgi:2-desacetyl-2-hydroxyethyl bacteriochlorophyllide A dehydrogenase